MKLFLKLLFTLLSVSLLAVSCGPNKPDNKIYKTEVKQTGWKPGPTTTDKPVPVVDTFVQISPTWGQAVHYASEVKGQRVWDIVGMVLLVILVLFIYGLATNASWVPNTNELVKGAFVFLLSISTLVAFKGRAASVKWNNDKWVLKTQFDKAIKETGSTKPIWDSLRNGCHITWGPYDCFKK